MCDILPCGAKSTTIVKHNYTLILLCSTLKRKHILMLMFGESLYNITDEGYGPVPTYTMLYICFRDVTMFMAGPRGVRYITVLNQPTHSLLS